MNEKMKHSEAAAALPKPDVGGNYLADYVRLVESGQASLGLKRLLTTLTESCAQDWLDCSRALVLRGDTQAAISVLSAAHNAHSEATDISISLAGMYHQTNRQVDAEKLLRQLLTQHPAHTAGNLLLMHVLKATGAMRAVTETAHTWFQHGRHDLAEITQVVELLDDCGRKEDAVTICESEIAAGSLDPRIHAYAATLLTQLGQFELARQRYLFALAGNERALEWNIATGLATLQRYKDRRHPDFELFEASLRRSDINEQTRASLLFALGKACDDIEDYAGAARHFRKANIICHSEINWSRKLWRRGIDARISRTSFSSRSAESPDWTPVFIVGMPRSGTTLLAELLSRYQKVSNRGELTLMQQLEQRFAQDDERKHGWSQEAFAIYEKQLRSEDPSATWYIDKQPHNFMCVDLILAIFPNAKIIYCHRNARDNTVSLWSQYFLPGTQNFSYDFADIAAVLQGCKRLMTHWQRRYASSIRTVQYEQLVTNQASCISLLSSWLGMTGSNMPDAMASLPNRAKVISSASLWQARQPVHTRSIERWRHYAPYVPELLRIPVNA